MACAGHGQGPNRLARVSAHEEESYRVRTRNSARVSTDARAVRTREALMSAAEQIALTDPFQLTAANVAAAAGVSRGAFYVHFDSIPDLANAMLVEKMRATTTDFSPLSPSQEWVTKLQQRIKDVVAHYDEHRVLYEAVRRMPGSRQAFDGAVQILADIVADTLKNHPGFPPGLDPAAAARWMAGGAFSVFDAWIDGSLQGDADRIADNLYQLLPGWYRRDQA